MDNIICEVLNDGLACPQLKQPWWEWKDKPFSAFVVRDIWSHEWQGIVRLFEKQVATPEITMPAIGLGGIYVSENIRGEGVGLAMMNRCCERIARIYQQQMLVLWSSRVQFYRAAGFTEVECPGLWMKSLSHDIEIRPGHFTWRVVPSERF
jgi:predicted N-acetyltransferase YhbS